MASEANGPRLRNITAKNTALIHGLGLSGSATTIQLQGIDLNRQKDIMAGVKIRTPEEKNPRHSQIKVGIDGYQGTRQRGILSKKRFQDRVEWDCPSRNVGLQKRMYYGIYGNGRGLDNLNALSIHDVVTELA